MQQWNATSKTIQGIPLQKICLIYNSVFIATRKN